MTTPVVNVNRRMSAEQAHTHARACMRIAIWEQGCDCWAWAKYRMRKGSHAQMIPCTKDRVALRLAWMACCIWQGSSLWIMLAWSIPMRTPVCQWRTCTSSPVPSAPCSFIAAKPSAMILARYAGGASTNKFVRRVAARCNNEAARVRKNMHSLPN